MARSEFRTVSGLLVDEVEVAPDVESDVGFDGEFVGADAPVDFGLFARVEAVDVDELGGVCCESK